MHIRWVHKFMQYDAWMTQCKDVTLMPKNSIDLISILALQAERPRNYIDLSNQFLICATELLYTCR